MVRDILLASCVSTRVGLSDVACMAAMLLCKSVQEILDHTCRTNVDFGFRILQLML
jgi:hypothetical protein